MGGDVDRFDEAAEGVDPGLGLGGFGGLGELEGGVGDEGHVVKDAVGVL